MDFDEYQRLARRTVITTEPDAFIFGLISEIGEVFSAYKKYVRENKTISELKGTPIHKDMIEQVGDVLWYLSAVSNVCSVNLNDAAIKNLEKTNTLFGKKAYSLFDGNQPEPEQFPRKFDVRISVKNEKVIMKWGHMKLGDDIDSNSYVEDEYRYHDVFHLAYVACLGWSPVIRKFMKRKRKTLDPNVDRVEDGARARVIEEAISAMIFEANRDLGPFSKIENIPIQLIVTIINMAKHFEVGSRNVSDWQLAISKGFQLFEDIVLLGEATVWVDLTQRDLGIKRG